MRNEQIIAMLQEEKKILEKIISEANLKISKAPEGTVQIRKHGNGVQYYHRKDPKDKNGSYMPEAERNKAHALIEKRYNLKVREAAEHQLKAIDRFLDKYDPLALAKVYADEGEIRRKLIKPYILPDDAFAKSWAAFEYIGKPFSDDTPVHNTSTGLRVRSKSEVIIAEALNRMGIPFRYECPLNINGKIIHPDFTILRLHDRREIYWEHLGMMDDTDYRNNAFQRIYDYEATGIFPGDRLILSFETIRLPLNVRNVEKLIRHYILDPYN